MRGEYKPENPISLPQQMELIQMAERIAELEQKLKIVERQAVRAREAANIGARFKNRTFESFDQTKNPQGYHTVKRFAERFDENQGDGLLLMGEPGTGKTHLAVATMIYIINEFIMPAKFISFNSFLEEIKMGFGENSDKVKTVIEMPLLVVDDIGKEKKTEWSNGVLYRIINERYEAMLPTIITTNLMPPELEKHCGDATFSRIIEMTEAVDCRGADYRKRKLGVM